MSEPNTVLHIHPSSALVIRADITIAETVKKMRESNVGSVLITSPDFRDELIGIFTERDLFQKVNLIENQAFWSKPIHLVMSKPVFSITIAEIGKAAEHMLTRHIRHIPIVYEDDEGKKRIAGVISIRDVLRDYHLRIQRYEEWIHTLPKNIQPAQTLAPDKKTFVGVFSKSIAFWRLLRDGKFNFPPPFNQILTDRLSMRNFLQEPELQFKRLQKYDAVFIDLDSRPPQEWSQFMKQLNHITIEAKIFIMFSPYLHSEKTQAIFKLFTQAPQGRYELFAKPVNIFDLLVKVPSLN